MWASVNACALLVGSAAFAGWTLSRFLVRSRKGWFHRFRGVGILALFFSIVSPEVVIGPGPDRVFGTSDDDSFQLQLIRPATASLTISAHTRVARRSLTDLWVDALVATGDILAPRTGRSFVADRPPERQTHFLAPISIHSPPGASWSRCGLNSISSSAGVLPLFVREEYRTVNPGFQHSGAIASAKRKSIWLHQENLYRKLLRPFAT